MTNNFENDTRTEAQNAASSFTLDSLRAPLSDPTQQLSRPDTLRTFGDEVLPTLRFGEQPNQFDHTVYSKDSTVARVTDANRDSVVQIYGLLKHPTDPKLPFSAGSGFFLDEHGTIATAYHVLKDIRGPVMVDTADGVTHKARIVGVDPHADVAVLSIDDGKQTQKVTLNENAQMAQGEPLIALGHPNGWHGLYVSPGTFNRQGPIDAVARTNNLGELDHKQQVFVTDSNTQAGSSGGPVFNQNGELVGMVDRGDGVHNYLIPAATLRSAAEHIMHPSDAQTQSYSWNASNQPPYPLYNGLQNPGTDRIPGYVPTAMTTSIMPFSAGDRLPYQVTTQTGDGLSTQATPNPFATRMPFELNHNAGDRMPAQIPSGHSFYSPNRVADNANNGEKAFYLGPALTLASRFMPERSAYTGYAAGIGVGLSGYWGARDFFNHDLHGIKTAFSDGGTMHDKVKSSINVATDGLLVGSAFARWVPELRPATMGASLVGSAVKIGNQNLW